MALVPRIYIDPYGQKVYRNDESSKRIFKEQNLEAGVIQSHYINQLTNILQNDTIITGLEKKEIFLSNNNRTINFVLTPGRIIQDNTLVDILEEVTTSIDIFTEKNIIGCNEIENYFEVSGNCENIFPTNKQFAIFNSDTSSYNHLNWIIEKSTFNEIDNKTRLYTYQSFNINDSSGQIICDNFENEDNSNKETILLFSKFKYEETVKDNLLEFIPVVVDSNDKYYPEFDSNLHGIIYLICFITKDLNEFDINIDANYICEDYITVNIDGHIYAVHNITDKYISQLDGGVII